MGEPADKKRVSGKDDVPPSTKPSRPVNEKKRESEDIERAVYDGMQDLRAEKPK